MRLTLAEPRYLKDSIAIIHELVNEARFKINSNAMELIAMDPANVAMVIFKLLSSCFTEYKVDGEVDLAVNLGSVKQILRRAKPNDMLTLEIDKDNKLKIQLKSSTTRTFSIPIIDVEDKQQKIPSLHFSATVKTPSHVLNEAIEDVDIVGESVVLEAEQGRFNVLAQGDISHAKIEIKEGEGTTIMTAGSDKTRAKYSIEYLKKMINGSKIADEVTIQFSKDYPLKLDYKTVDKVMLSFILAPRVEND